MIQLEYNGWTTHLKKHGNRQIAKSFQKANHQTTRHLCDFGPPHNSREFPPKKQR